MHKVMMIKKTIIEILLVVSCKNLGINEEYLFIKTEFLCDDHLSDVKISMC